MQRNVEISLHCLACLCSEGDSGSPKCQLQHYVHNDSMKNLLNRLALIFWHRGIRYKASDNPRGRLMIRFVDRIQFLEPLVLDLGQAIAFFEGGDSHFDQSFSVDAT